MKTTLIITLIFIVMLFSCNNHTKQVNWKGDLIGRNFGNGEFIEYYTNGIIKKNHLNRNETTNDTLFNYLKLDTIKDLQNEFVNKFYSINYDQNGFLNSKGFIDSTYIKIGIWSYYQKNNFKYNVEYFNVTGEAYVNRIWSKSNKGGMRSNLYRLDTNKDTFSIGENIRLKIYLTYPIISYKSDIYILLPKKKEGNVLKGNFNNMRELEYDTVKNINLLLKEKGREVQKYDNLRAVIDFVYSKIGKKSIKGIIVEKLETKDSILINELLFTKEIFIMPQLPQE